MGHDGPWSTDHWQGLLHLIHSVEPQSIGPRTGVPGPRAFSIGIVGSLEGGFLWVPNAGTVHPAARVHEQSIVELLRSIANIEITVYAH